MIKNNSIPTPNIPVIIQNAASEAITQLSPTYINSLLQSSQSAKALTNYYPDHWEELNNTYSEDKAVIKVKSDDRILSKKESEIYQSIKKLFHYTQYTPPQPTFQKLQEKEIYFSETASRNSLDIIPPEILSLVFQKVIGSWQDLGQLSRTCKKFYNAINNKSFLKSLFLQQPSFLNEIFNDVIARGLINRSGFNPTRLESLQRNLNDEDLFFLSENGSNLESISFQGANFTPDGLARFLKKCPIKSIEFNACNIKNFDDFIAVLCCHAPLIEYLKIIDCPMTDQALIFLSAAKRDLHTFEYADLTGSGKLSDLGFYPFINRSKSLKSLKITGCPLTTQCSIRLLLAEKKGARKSECLKHLTFAYCGLSNEHLLRDLADHFRNLESLELSYLPSFNFQPGSYLMLTEALLDVAENCVLLKKLKLSDCPFLDNDTIVTFLDCCENLNELELYRSNPLTLEFLQTAFDHPLKTFNFEPRQLNINPAIFVFPGKLPRDKIENFNLINCPIQEGTDLKE